MLVTWVSSQPFAHRASSFLAGVGAKRRGFANGHSDGSQKKPLHYSPWNGSLSFWYKYRLLTFRSVQNENRFFPKEDISISCIGRSPKILIDLFSECRIEYLKLVKNNTSIFEHYNGDWSKTRTVDIRELDTVILNKEEKTALLEDVKSFLDLESRVWYSVRGIPYRRGYLLYGPPGTGKSSLSLSIAGEFDLDIYILNISSVDEDSLRGLFAELPARCVVLLEDIDAVNATHSRQDVTTSSTKERPEGKVSLSALLNAIDGVASQEGRLLIMTTNHVERLDAALIRPGRVDMKLELGLTTYDINAQLFFTIFSSNVSNKAKFKNLEAEEETELKEMAADFASKVPEHVFSPADIQLFLLGYKKSPAMALQNVQEWLVRAQEERGHVKRADPWVSEKRFRSDNHTTPPDKTASLSATTQDGEMASALAAMEMPIPTINSHCCSCQVLEDIRGICAAKEMPSVHSPLPEG
jgi:chaperone BCS1